MPQRERQVDRGFPIRSKEWAVLGGVLVNAHGHVECALDGGHRALELQVHTIAGPAYDGKTVC